MDTLTSPDEWSIWKMIDLSHEEIMETLAQPVQQPKVDHIYHLTCLNIVEPFPHVQSSFSTHELGIIADYLHTTYGLLHNDKSTELSPPNQLEPISLTALTEESEILHEKLDLNHSEVSSSMEIDDSKMMLLDSANEYIFDTTRSTCWSIIDSSFIYFGQALRDSKLTHLSLSNTKVTSNLLIEFLKYLPQSPIVSFDLPEIVGRIPVHFDGVDYDDDDDHDNDYLDDDDHHHNHHDNDYLDDHHDNDDHDHNDKGCLDKLYNLCCGYNCNTSHTSSEIGHNNKNRQDDEEVEEVEINWCQHLATILKDTEINSLDFNGNAINLEMLTCSLVGTKISFLSFRGCKVEDNDLNRLASVLKDTLLTSIDLSNNSLNCVRLKMIVNGLEGTSIATLNLSSNRIGVDGLNCLGGVLKNTAITTIDLSGNRLNCECLKVFAPYLVGTNITSLNLAANQIGIDGLKCLAHVLKDTKIESIDLGSNRLSYESFKILSNCLLDTRITSLCLRGNVLDTDCLNCMTQSLKESKISSIDLSESNLQCDSLKLLSSALVSSKIDSLNLSHNRIGVDGINSLVEILKDTEITTLDISYNGLRDINVCSRIFACLNETKIDSLNVLSNLIDYEYLANILKGSKVTSIDLGYPPHYQDFEMFVSCLDNSIITCLNLSNNYHGLAFKKLVSVLKYTLITSLNLGKCSLSCNDLTDLLLCLPDTKITSLNLNGSRFCGNIIYLASVLKCAKITSLDLSNCRILENNHISVVEEEIDSGDTSLDLSDCCCFFSLCYLSRQLCQTKITHLNLSGNEMVYNSMKYLSKGLLSSHIVALDLSRARVDCCGVRDLAKVLRYTRISSLNLSCNKIACKGIGYLTDGLVGCRISSLNLFKNKIACQGFKYLMKGCRIESLNLRENLIKDEGVQHLAENLANTDISEIDLCGNMIGSQAAYQLFNSAKQKSMNHIKKDVTKVHLDVKSDDLISHMSLYKYPDCLVQISEPCSREDFNCLINNTYKNLGITKLVLEGEHFTHMLGAFDNISITEYDHSFREPIPRNYSKDHSISQILLNSNIAVLNVNASDCRRLLNEENLILKLKVIAIKMKIAVFEQLVGYCARGVKSTLINSNVVYLDLSNNKLIGDDFGLLVEFLKGSKIISLNLSNNLLKERSAELLAEVLPLTKIIYIDLYGNRIGYLGYIYLVKAAPKSRVCWLSLGNNNIEERLRENIDLSPYIVPRDDTPIEFQIRYLFRELVSLNSTSEQFEFVVPHDDSVMNINDYPLLLKYLPDYKIHIYDYFYMKSMRRHDIHMLNKVNAFVKDMKHKFNAFIEGEMVKLGEKFGYDSFVVLVKLCDCLDLSDFVELLLLHRVLYYVDDELNFLHPFIYKMLHKHQLPLYASFEPNKRQQIISYFEKHSDIDCAREIINLLDRL